MSIKDNFGNPQGLLGRWMLSGMNMGHTAMAKWAFAQFDVLDEGTIVDIGCGGGFNIKRLLERSSKAKIYGVDISEVSVSKSKATNQSEIGNRCEVYQAGADNLPFDDNSVDLATAFETVYFWNEIEKCFAEVYRTIKPGGRFIVINDPGDPKKNWDKMVSNMTSWKPEEIEEFMKGAGFTDITSVRQKYTYLVSGTKK